MNLAAYLDRIASRGSLIPTPETLRRLHLAHLYSVPFENLSIHWGEPIELDDEALFEKVVARRRGGFCYELNGLFAALLRALGFDVTMVAAEVTLSGMKLLTTRGGERQERALADESEVREALRRHLGIETAAGLRRRTASR